MTNKIHTKESIQQLLLTNDKAVERAIVAIYNLQTDDEKHTEETKHHNGVGFNSADSHLGSYLATYILKGRSLSGEFLIKARKMSLKYVLQLLEIANKKGKQ